MNPIARRNMVTVPSPLPARVHQIYDAFPGYHKISNDGELLFEVTRSHLEIWDSTFPELPIEDSDGSIARLKQVLDVPAVVSWNLKYPPRMKPWEHQARSINIAMSRDMFAFWSDKGCGKSSVIIRLIAEMFGDYRIGVAIIVTQGRVIDQFIEEQFPKHAPEGFSYLIGQLPMGKYQQREWEISKKSHILVVSPGAFSSKKQTAEIRRFIQGKQAAIFIDESHAYKDYSGVRFDTLLKMKPLFKYRYLFSGEPQPKGMIDLFSQFYFMDKNIIGHEGITAFRSEFCFMGGFKGGQVLEYKNVERFTARVAPFCEYVQLRDCMDMPKQQWIESRFKPTQE